MDAEEAYRHCLALARSHYENFPVASVALPRRMRGPVAAVYAFARTADDLADEGAMTAEQRLQALTAYEQSLASAAAGAPPDDPIFIALADLLARFELTAEPFSDLLSAFRQDVVKRRYADSDELLDYCRRSANPVGRILLHLHGAADPVNLGLSDRICTALQLINFLQDIGQDYDENDRIYLPLDEMARCGVGEKHLRERIDDSAMMELFGIQLERARTIMLAGAPLGSRLTGRFGLEIRLITAGGLLVLDRLQRSPGAFSRPRLRRRDLILLLLRSLRRQSPSASTPHRAGTAGR